MTYTIVMEPKVYNRMKDYSEYSGVSKNAAMTFCLYMQLVKAQFECKNFERIIENVGLEKLKTKIPREEDEDNGKKINYQRVSLRLGENLSNELNKIIDELKENYNFNISSFITMLINLELVDFFNRNENDNRKERINQKRENSSLYKKPTPDDVNSCGSKILLPGIFDIHLSRIASMTGIPKKYLIALILVDYISKIYDNLKLEGFPIEGIYMNML